MAYYGLQLPPPEKDIVERLEDWRPSNLTGENGVAETARLINDAKHEINQCICRGNWRGRS